MSAGFKVMKVADNGFKMIRPLKMKEGGSIETNVDFSIQVDAQGKLLTACGVGMSAPSRRPINFREPCKFHIDKLQSLIEMVPNGDGDVVVPTLLGRPLTDGGLSMTASDNAEMVRRYLMIGEMYRIARDLHRVDVKLSTTEGYNFELVMGAIANGATPVIFNVGTGVEMAAFFVVGTDWVHTVSSIDGLYFGVGVVEASFIDFFKSIIFPYIEVEKYNA